NDNLVKLWSAGDGSPVRELNGHTCHVYNVAFHPDGRHLVSGDLRGVVKQWDVARGAEVRTLDAACCTATTRRSRPTSAGCGAWPSAATVRCWGARASPT